MDPYADPNVVSAPPRQGMGCFAKGCLTLVVVGFLLLGLIGFFGYRMYQSISGYIADRPANVRIFPATDEQYQAVAQKLAPFDAALQGGQRATVELNGDDLNILVARDPNFRHLRGNTSFTIAGDEIVADVSQPLDASSGHAARYYFNGRLAAGVLVDNGEVEMMLHRIEVNGKSLPRWAMDLARNKDFMKEFNRSFNDSFANNPKVRDLLSRLHSARLVGDKLVLTSVGAEPVAAPPAAP